MIYFFRRIFRFMFRDIAFCVVYAVIIGVLAFLSRFFIS